MLRSSSGRTACASLANGSSSRIISLTPTYRSGTICTEKPGGSARVELPSCGDGVAAHGGGLRHDQVQAAVAHHRRAVHAQQRLQRRRQRFARDARRRADGHRAADRRVDRVVLVEDVAQDVAHDFAQVGALEVEHDAAAGGLGRRRRRQLAAGLLALHDDARALVDVRRIARASACAPGGGIGQRRRQRSVPFIGIEPLPRPGTVVLAHRCVWHPARAKATAAASDAKSGDLLEVHCGFAAMRGRSPVDCRNRWASESSRRGPRRRLLRLLARADARVGLAPARVKLRGRGRRRPAGGSIRLPVGGALSVGGLPPRRAAAAWPRPAAAHAGARARTGRRRCWRARRRRPCRGHRRGGAHRLHRGLRAGGDLEDQVLGFVAQRRA